MARARGTRLEVLHRSDVSDNASQRVIPQHGLDGRNMWLSQSKARSIAQANRADRRRQGHRSDRSYMTPGVCRCPCWQRRNQETSPLTSPLWAAFWPCWDISDISTTFRPDPKAAGKQIVQPERGVALEHLGFNTSVLARVSLFDEPSDKLYGQRMHARNLGPEGVIKTFALWHFNIIRKKQSHATCRYPKEYEECHLLGFGIS